MRTALGLDVDAVTSFAAIVVLDSASTRPRELPISPPSAFPSASGHDDSIVEAARAAIALATQREGESPVAVTLAHPLGWDGGRIERLRRALVQAEITGVSLVDSAVAAAVGADATRPIPVGHVVTVVALRDGGAEVRSLCKDGDASFHAVAAPISVAGVAEADFDAALRSLVDHKIVGGIPGSDPGDAVLTAALDRLHVAIRIARDRLCDDESTFVGVRLPGRATVVQLDRAEFEDAVAPALVGIVPALQAAILAATAGTGAADEVLLTGTAAPTPLLAELLRAELDIPVIVSDARHGGSFGAAIAAAAGAVSAAGTGTVAPTGAPAARKPVAVPRVVQPVVATKLARATRVANTVPAEKVSGQQASAKKASTAAPVRAAAAVGTVATVVPQAAARPTPTPKAKTPSMTPTVAPTPAVVLPKSAVPVSAVAHVNAAPAKSGSRSARLTRPRKPVGILQLWPIAAAAAVLVVLGGAATVGALDLTPTGTDHSTSPATTTTDGAETQSDSSSGSGAVNAGAGAAVDVDAGAGAGAVPGSARESPANGRSGSATTAPGVAASPSSSSSSSSPSTPTSPSSDPTTPSSDPTTPSSDPTTPSSDPTTPSSDPTTPSDEPTTPSDEPTP